MRPIQSGQACFAAVTVLLPREYDIQFDTDCRVVLLPRENVVDRNGGYVELDLNPCLPVAIGTLVPQSNAGVPSP